MNDIERVAQVMEDKLWIRHHSLRVQEIDTDSIRDAARAAILEFLDCLKEPSAEMCDKGADMPAAGTDFPEAIAKWTWQAMLEAKRKEIEDGSS